MVNSVLSGGIIWGYRSGSTLAQVITAPGHHLNQYWHISEVLLIYLRAISWEILKITITDMSLKIINLRLPPHLPGAHDPDLLSNTDTVLQWCHNEHDGVSNHRGGGSGLLAQLFIEMMYQYQHIKIETKWMPFSRHFQMRFRQLISLHFDLKSVYVYSQIFSWQLASIGSGNG